MSMRRALARIFRLGRRGRPPLTILAPVAPPIDNSIVENAASAAVFLGINKRTAKLRAAAFYRAGMSEGELLKAIISGD